MCEGKFLFRKVTCLPLGTAQVKAFLQNQKNQNPSLYCLCIEKTTHTHKNLICTRYIKGKQVAAVLSPSVNRTQYKPEVVGIERNSTGLIRSAENSRMNRLKWLGEFVPQGRHLKENMIIVVKVRNGTGKIDKKLCWDSSVPCLNTRLWRHSVKL